MLAPELIFYQKNAESASELEHEIRVALPIGSSLPTVEAYLKRRNLEFSFDPQSSTVHAIERRLKGSNIVQIDLSLQFHFDNSPSLKSIDAKRWLTGP